jgi:DNA-binding GntR family transcriptional regulator
MDQEIRDITMLEVGRRIVSGELAPGTRLDEEALALQLGTTTETVHDALVFLRRDGFVSDVAGGGFAVSELDEADLREIYPVALLLEGLAVRTAPPYPPEVISRLRAINDDMRRDAADPAASARHDHAFHDELVRRCGNDQLMTVVRPLKRTLLRYELAYMSERRNVGESTRQHDGIIAALEQHDHETAAAGIEANFRDTMPRLIERLPT